MTIGYWHGEGREREVIVVGAGIAGLSASRELAERGVDHLVLERGSIGCSASTRNAGFLMRGAADNYAAACEVFGRERARVLWRWSEGNLALLRRAGIEGLRSYRATPSCLLAIDGGEAEELDRSRAMLAEDGFEVGWRTEGEDAAWRSGIARVGLVNPGDAVCNPAELIRWLAGPIFERVRQGVAVERIEVAERRVRIATDAGEFVAERVLLCTNAHAGSLSPQLAALVTPRRGQMVALRAPGVRLDCAYYVNHGHEYIREAGDGVVVVGGCRGMFADQEIGQDDATAENVQAAIEAFAADLLGARYEVMHRWAGIMGFTSDALPIVAPLPELDDRVWFCGGFTGHGMSLAHKTARAAVAQMLDGTPCPFSTELA